MVRGSVVSARSVRLLALLRTTFGMGALGAALALLHCGPHGRTVVDDEAPSANGFDTSTPAGQTPDICQGIECDVVACPPGAETTVSGVVYAPNGTLPLSGATVYVANGSPPDLHAGASCETCSALLPERPITIATSGADGAFQLRGVPIGTDIPIVIQVGKWRRTITVPKVEACVDHALPAQSTRLPRNRTEGSMPRIALTTGACDDVGCLLPKLGIDPSEIGVSTDGDARRVHVYRGAMNPADAPKGALASSTLWASEASLSAYDMLLLSCECGERLENKGAAANEAMTRYLDRGGRIFTTDYMYTWYRDTPSADLRRAISVLGGGHDGGHPVMVKGGDVGGRPLLEWLRATSTPSPALTEGQIELESVFDNLESVDPSRARVWASSSRPSAPSSPNGPRIVSVDFPIAEKPSNRCGRAVHIDGHVNQAVSGDRVGPDYPSSCASTMNTGEATLAFFLFHLADCILPPVAKPGVPPQR